MRRLSLVLLALLFFAAAVIDAGPIRRLNLFPRLRPAPTAPSEPREVVPSEKVTPVAAHEIAPVTMHAARALNKKSFAGALQGQLASKGRLTIGEKHILNILNAPDSAKRDRQLKRMERHVRAELDLHPTEAVDWSAIDWPTLFQTILQLLLKLLPLLLL